MGELQTFPAQVSPAQQSAAPPQSCPWPWHWLVGVWQTKPPASPAPGRQLPEQHSLLTWLLAALARQAVGAQRAAAFSLVLS